MHLIPNATLNATHDASSVNPRVSAPFSTDLLLRILQLQLPPHLQPVLYASLGIALDPFDLETLQSAEISGSSRLTISSQVYLSNHWQTQFT